MTCHREVRHTKGSNEAVITAGRLGGGKKSAAYSESICSFSLIRWCFSPQAVFRIEPRLTSYVNMTCFVEISILSFDTLHDLQKFKMPHFIPVTGPLQTVISERTLKTESCSHFFGLCSELFEAFSCNGWSFLFSCQCIFLNVICIVTVPVHSGIKNLK